MFDDIIIYNQLRHIRAENSLILRMLSRNLKMETDMAATLQDILDKQEASRKLATDALTVDDAIKVISDSNTQRLTDLQARIDELIAAGTTAPADLQKLSDNMDAIIAAQSADADRKAILAGTPPGTGAL